VVVFVVLDDVDVCVEDEAPPTPPVGHGVLSHA
jgi:hypothetical protein